MKRQHPTEDLRSPLARARDEWLASEEGRGCCNPTTLRAPADQAEYLHNRIEAAFRAGALAQEAIDRQAVEAAAQAVAEASCRPREGGAEMSDSPTLLTITCANCEKPWTWYRAPWSTLPPPVLCEPCWLGRDDEPTTPPPPAASAPPLPHAAAPPSS